MVTSALLDLRRAVANTQTSMALIGGQALQVYGVPNTTQDADALIPREDLEPVAVELVDTFGWTPLDFDDRTGDYVPTDRPVILIMQDPVLFDIHEEREMIPFCTPLELLVELLAVQHPVEQEMLDRAASRIHYEVRVPVAPLGGVLLVKTKAHRGKDTTAIEQAAEHILAAELDAAIEWAARRDPATAEDLRSIVAAVRLRRTPNGRRSPRRRG